MKNLILTMNRIEILQTQENNEKSDLDLLHVSDGSVYAAEELADGRIAIGGSVWDRRRIPFTKELAESTPGIFYVINVDQPEVDRAERKSLLFPSMVNVVLPFEDSLVVCCKHGRQTYTRIDQGFKILSQSDSREGGGVYNSLYDTQRNRLVAATRFGKLEIVNAESMEIEESIEVGSANTRLWSLCQSSNGDYITGDYDGNLYAIFQGNEVITCSPASIVEGSLPFDRKLYSPSVFGLTSLPDSSIVAGLRWGIVFWLDSRLDIKKHVDIGEEISYISSIPDSNDLMLGTRSGRILRMWDHESNFELTEIYSIPPSVQSDNSVWSISFNEKNSCIASFADGQVIKVSV